MLKAVIRPKTRDLGEGVRVRRALPAAEKRAVGPFVFLDQMGPVRLAPGKGLDVRPHPHIGLATLTWLYEGEILHRDSLGSVQAIRPGEVNWMTAGRGIAHSERTPEALRSAGPRMSGLQIWIGLPAQEEECEPAFAHFKADALPRLGEHLRLVAGTLEGARAPVPVRSPMFCVDAALPAGETLMLSPEHEERAAYVISGEITVAGQAFGDGQLVVLEPGGDVPFTATRDARVMLIGGAPLDGYRHMWWNFVSSRKDRIAQAAADWKAGRFAPVPGDPEHIPLPDNAPGVVDYP